MPAALLDGLGSVLPALDHRFDKRADIIGGLLLPGRQARDCGKSKAGDTVWTYTALGRIHRCGWAEFLCHINSSGGFKDEIHINQINQNHFLAISRSQAPPGPRNVQSQSLQVRAKASAESFLWRNNVVHNIRFPKIVHYTFV